MSAAELPPGGAPRPEPGRPLRAVHDGPEIDLDLVADVRRAVAESLATRLQAAPGMTESARRDLARGLVAAELAVRRKERVRRGLVAWPAHVESRTSSAVMAAIFGAGRLQPLVDDPDVENIVVNGCDRVRVSYADGRQVLHPAVADSDQELIEVLQGLAARAGSTERAFSPAHPRLHLRLQDGARLAAVAWICPRPQVVIRRHRVIDVDLNDLVRLGTLDSVLASFLRSVVRAGKNVVVTGLQNAGKTTLVRALANEFGPAERFATIEKEYELHLQDLPDRHPDMVPLEAREGSSEVDAHGHAAGEVTLGQLVTDALRLNLRRIIVGEVRGDEVLPMLDAMSTGDGSLCTLHARTAQHGIDRLVTLCLQAGVGMNEVFAYRLLGGAVDFIVHVHLEQDRDDANARPARYVSQVIEISGIGEGSRPATTTVFAPGPDRRAVPVHRPECLDDLILAGFDPDLLAHRHGTWPARRALHAGGAR